MGHTAINPLRRIYLHTALQTIVEASGGIFVVGFLASRGLSYPAALASFALILLSRFAMRPLVLPLTVRAGLRTTLLAGVVVRAAGFLFLPLVTSVGPVLGLFLLVTGLGNVLYWTAWHAYMPSLTDAERGGRQVSAQQATSAVVGVIAPAAGGLLLAHTGPWTAFVVIALVQLAAGLPLIGAPNPRVSAEARLDPQDAAHARKLYFTEGFHAGCGVVVWNLALFASLGEKFDQMGAAMAAAGIAAAGGSVVVGRLIDSGRPRHSLIIAYGAAALTLAVKGMVFAHPLFAVFATALGALVTPMTATAMLTTIYAMSRNSPCVLRFSMATEGGWDLGCSAACLVTAAMLASGASFRLPILLGLGAVAVIAVMLDRWYLRDGPEAGDPEAGGPAAA